MRNTQTAGDDHEELIRTNQGLGHLKDSKSKASMGFYGSTRVHPSSAVLFRSCPAHERVLFCSCVCTRIDDRGSRISDGCRRGVMARTISTQRGKRLGRTEGREDQTMKPRQLREGQLAFAKYTRALRPSKPSTAKNRLLSDARNGGAIADQTGKFPRGVGRLYLAIVNRAILDVLENGKNSAAAERWLLSRDFDRLQELFD